MDCCTVQKLLHLYGCLARKESGSSGRLAPSQRPGSRPAAKLFRAPVSDVSEQIAISRAPAPLTRPPKPPAKHLYEAASYEISDDTSYEAVYEAAPPSSTVVYIVCIVHCVLRIVSSMQCAACDITT